MVATRFLVLVLAGLLWAPNAFATAPVAGQAAYEVVSNSGANNIVDVTALGACEPSTGLHPGCRDIDGNMCTAGAKCNLERVPVGRCSRGGNAACVWPSGAGSCTIDTLRPCLVPADCPDSGDSCDLTSNDPNCACTPTNETLGTKCGTAGVCSDGDQFPLIVDQNGNPFDAARLGGPGTSLCTDIALAGPNPLNVTNCGEASGQTLKGMPNNIENVALTPVPQRAPGGLGVDAAPINQLRATNVYTWGVPDSHGVRRFVNEGDAQWSDWAFNNKTISGAPVSSVIETYYCDLPVGWKTDQNFVSSTGTCATGSASCNTDADCVGNGPCNDTNNDRTCYSSKNKTDNFGWVWTDPAFVPGGVGTCPPDCGTSYDLNTISEQAIKNVTAANKFAGIQLALNNLSNHPATFGDAITATSLFSFSWIGDADLRCFINGETAADSLAGWVGRCNTTTDLCNPDSGAPGLKKGGGTCDCRHCNTTQDAAGLCADNVTTCQVDSDCPLQGVTSPNGLCFYDGVHETLVAEADRNQPDGFNTHGFSTVSPNHRTGGIGGVTWQVPVPLTILGVTGDVALQFRDNGSSTKTTNSQTLGKDVGGTVGIGAGGTFAATGPGVFPAFPLQSNPSPISWNSEHRGAEVGLLHRTENWYPGADGIPGCIGDSSKPLLACDDALGISGAGNTGIDDVQAIADIGPACIKTCVGPSDPSTGTQGKLCDAATASSPVTCAAGLTCACSGLDATNNAADTVPDPTAAFPTIRTVSAGSVKDLTVFFVPDDTDAIFKVESVNCPYVGACATGGAQCGSDADCGGGAGSCAGIKLTCAVDPCASLGGDTDNDGICDDGDGSGTAGDNTCTGGATTGCDDNCRYTANATQADVGGVGAVPPDGIGNACQCGDVNNNGKVASNDATLIRKELLGLNPTGFKAPQKCNVKGPAGPGDCKSSDASQIRKKLLGITNGFGQVCAPAQP